MMKTRRCGGCCTSGSFCTWRAGRARRLRCLSCRVIWLARERKTRRRSASWCVTRSHRPPGPPILRTPRSSYKETIERGNLSRAANSRPPARLPTLRTLPPGLTLVFRWQVEEGEQERKRRQGVEQQLEKERGSMVIMQGPCSWQVRLRLGLRLRLRLRRPQPVQGG